MNNNINTVTASPSAAANADAVSSVSPAMTGASGVEDAVVSSPVASFQDSIRKALDDSQQASDASDSQSSGNSLPASAESAAGSVYSNQEPGHQEPGYQKPEYQGRNAVDAIDDTVADSSRVILQQQTSLPADKIDVMTHVATTDVAIKGRSRAESGTAAATAMETIAGLDAGAASSISQSDEAMPGASQDERLAQTVRAPSISGSQLITGKQAITGGASQPPVTAAQQTAVSTVEQTGLLQPSAGLASSQVSAVQASTPVQNIDTVSLDTGMLAGTLKGNEPGNATAGNATAGSSATGNATTGDTTSHLSAPVTTGGGAMFADDVAIQASLAGSRAVDGNGQQAVAAAVQSKNQPQAMVAANADAVRLKGDAILAESAVMTDVARQQQVSSATQATAQTALDTLAKDGIPVVTEAGRQQQHLAKARSLLHNILARQSTGESMSAMTGLHRQHPVITGGDVTPDALPVTAAVMHHQQAIASVQSALLQATPLPTEAAAATSAMANISPAHPAVHTAPNMAMNTSLNAAQALPQLAITEAFGRPAWSQGMGKQIVMMVNQNISNAEIRMNPAHLGPIEIMIDMNDDQVNVSLSSRHAHVREAMEQALPRLREMLDENGFDLADADISKHSFAEQREQQSGQNNNALASAWHDPRMSSEISEQSIQQSVQQSIPQASGASSEVDYYI